MPGLLSGIRGGAVLGLGALGLLGSAEPAAAQGAACPPTYAVVDAPLVWGTGYPRTALTLVEFDTSGRSCAPPPADGPLPRAESGVGWSTGRQFVVTRGRAVAFRDQTCSGLSSGYRGESGRCLSVSEYRDAWQVNGPPGEYLNDPTRNPITGQ
jgi:hypothetical protein